MPTDNTQTLRKTNKPKSHQNVAKAPGGPGAFRLHPPTDASGSDAGGNAGEEISISTVVDKMFQMMRTDVADIGQLLRFGTGLVLEGRSLMRGANVALVFHGDDDIEIYYEPMLLEFLDRFETLSRAHLDSLRAFEAHERRRGLETVILAGRWAPPLFTRRGGMKPYMIGRRFDDGVTYSPYTGTSWRMAELLPLSGSRQALEVKSDLRELARCTQEIIDADNERFAEIDGIPLVEGVLWSVMDRSDRHSDGRMLASFRMMSNSVTSMPELRSKML